MAISAVNIINILNPPARSAARGQFYFARKRSKKTVNKKLKKNQKKSPLIRPILVVIRRIIWVRACARARESYCSAENTKLFFLATLLE